MKVSDYCSVGSSSAAKGFKKDASQREIIKRREKKRRGIQDVNDFMATLAAILPEYYGDNQWQQSHTITNQKPLHGIVALPITE